VEPRGPRGQSRGIGSSGEAGKSRERERRNDGTTGTEETQMAAETSGIDADNPEQQTLENPTSERELILK
jgi:hypothetical protein